MKLVRNMIVRDRTISIGLQCLILNSYLKGVCKFEIATYVIDWLDCPQREAIRIVDSVIGVTTSELETIRHV